MTGRQRQKTPTAPATSDDAKDIPMTTTETTPTATPDTAETTPSDDTTSYWDSLIETATFHERRETTSRVTAAKDIYPQVQAFVDHMFAKGEDGATLAVRDNEHFHEFESQLRAIADKMGKGITVRMQDREGKKTNNAEQIRFTFGPKRGKKPASQRHDDA